jgi:hypothetical protein
MKGYMPFPNADLRIPTEYQKEIEAYSLSRPTGGERLDPEDAPFPRQVDMWFLAVCLGALGGQRVKLGAQQTHKFNTASIFETDPGRIEILELLAIAEEDDAYAIREPREVIEIANELAAGGLPLVIEMLRDGNSTAIDNLSQRLQLRLREVLPAVGTQGT